MSKFKIIDENIGIVAVELPENVLGGNTAIEFTGLLNEFIANNYSLVIVDFSNVKLMNSTGLGMLANAHALLEKNSIKSVLVGIPDKIYKLFEITHLTEVFEIYPDLETALSKL